MRFAGNVRKFALRPARHPACASKKYAINMKIAASFKSAAILCAAILAASPAICEVKPARIFSDNMVIQANAPIRVWGTAEKGEKVSVEFLGSTASTVADENGNWRVSLPPKKYLKEGAELTISGINKIVYRDVLVGEVWLGSGQSNMEFQIRHVKEMDDLIKTKNLPENIRYFWIRAHGSEKPEDMHNLPEAAAWKKYHKDNYETTRDMSLLLTLFAQKLNAQLDVPVGVIGAAFGGANLETWMSEEAIAEAGTSKEAAELLKRCRQWHNDDVKRWEAHEKRDTLRYPRINYESRPSQSYNAMIHPIIPFSIRGVLWYQGEMNSGPELYLKQFPFYAKMMRKVFENPKMPIYTVQLPDYKEKHWPKMRDVQRKLADMVENSGMAVTIDGHEIDLHPRDKTMVVDRLSRMVLADNYGVKIVSRSPSPVKAAASGGTVKVTFKDVANGLKLKDGREVRTFELAGEDGRFHPAPAKILSKDSVLVGPSKEVPNPAKVRYAWAPDPDVNLYNSGDLPASPFELDLN